MPKSLILRFRARPHCDGTFAIDSETNVLIVCPFLIAKQFVIGWPAWYQDMHTAYSHVGPHESTRGPDQLFLAVLVILVCVPRNCVHIAHTFQESRLVRPAAVARSQPRGSGKRRRIRRIARSPEHPARLTSRSLALKLLAVPDEGHTGFERPGRSRDHRHRPPRRDPTDAHGRQGDEDSNNRDRADDELHIRSFLGQDGAHARLRLCAVPGQVALSSYRQSRCGAGRANQAQQRVDREGLVQDAERPELPHPRRVGGTADITTTGSSRSARRRPRSTSQPVASGRLMSSSIRSKRLRSQPRWPRRPSSPPPRGSRGPQVIALGSAAAAAHPPPGESIRS